MSTRIIAETPKQRNRRLLLAAFDRGVHVAAYWGNHYTVTSATQAGKLHEVMIWMDSDFNRHEECTCDWAVKRGAVITFNAGTRQQHTNGVPPCSHILMARWERMSAAARALLLEDPEIAAAWEARGQLAEVA